MSYLGGSNKTPEAQVTLVMVLEKFKITVPVCVGRHTSWFADCNRHREKVSFGRFFLL